MKDDSEKIKRHYEESKIFTTKERKELPTINIRKFNNYIKAVLLKNHIKLNDAVLDLGCGKGGDINKYAELGISEYVGMDIASACIEEAKKRHKMRRTRFKANFVVKDCFNEQFDLQKMFDVITLQFSFHYAFVNENSLSVSLSNISKHLKDGGKVIATIPNSEAILRRLKKYGNNFGNEFYSVKFVDDKITENTLGVEYYFTLRDSIDQCIEYLIYIDLLKKECEKYDLKIVEFVDFATYFNQNVKKHLALYNLMVNTRLTTSEIAVPQLYSIIVLIKEKK